MLRFQRLCRHARIGSRDIRDPRDSAHLILGSTVIDLRHCAHSERERTAQNRACVVVAGAVLRKIQRFLNGRTCRIEGIVVRLLRICSVRKGDVVGDVLRLFLAAYGIGYNILRRIGQCGGVRTGISIGEILQRQNLTARFPVRVRAIVGLFNFFRYNLRRQHARRDLARACRVKGRCRRERRTLTPRHPVVGEQMMLVIGLVGIRLRPDIIRNFIRCRDILRVCCAVALFECRRIRGQRKGNIPLITCYDARCIVRICLIRGEINLGCIR